jgi:arylsulfatase A-like enzyme
MKAVFILSDSFRRDHIGAYGNSWVHTPNLDCLAGMSHVFDRMYTGSFPTGPNRRDIHVGKGEAPGTPFNSWKNIEPDEVTLAARLGEAGVHTQMITDVANGSARGANMWEGFGAYTINRGQEGDSHFSDDAACLDYPLPQELIRYSKGQLHKVLMNRARRRCEEDYFAPGTFRMACEWLERNRTREDFLLWLEVFDPHEPWDPPPWYVDRYDPGYDGRVFEFPTYGYYRKMGITDREMQHTQARYAGEVTMVDHAVGRLLATLDRLDLLGETAIFFTSDHGIYAGHEGDAGCVGKPWLVCDDTAWLVGGDFTVRNPTYLPLRTGTMRIPLFIRLPGQSEQVRHEGIVQPWDLHPTVLEMFGVGRPDDLQGESLIPALGGGALPEREYALNCCLYSGVGTKQAMNREWIYTCWPDGNRTPNLIDLRENPAQDCNVAAENPGVCCRMHEALAAYDPASFEGVKNPW